jgi:hypothetical protein
LQASSGLGSDLGGNRDGRGVEGICSLQKTSSKKFQASSINPFKHPAFFNASRARWTQSQVLMLLLVHSFRYAVTMNVTLSALHVDPEIS